MIAWNQQGPAWVAQIALKDGRRATVVVVGDTSNPNGAALVLPGEDGASPQHMPLREGQGLFNPWVVIEILCMQERVFGTHGLPVPEFQEAQS